jgi:5-methylcytosine-specific restriction endonuclease McrA
MKARRDRNNAMLRALKSALGCKDCGEKDPLVLEFDHQDPKTKKFNIGMRVHGSIAKLMDEIAKCDVRCANCHRRRTFRESHY